MNNRIQLARHSEIDRREFISRAALLLPLMHLGGFSTTDALAMNHDQPATAPASSARIARLRLNTHVVDDMAKFYRSTLGLPVSPIDGGGISIACGQTIIEFFPAEGDTKPFYHFAFNIPQNKLDKTIEWMKPRHPLFVRDDGNVIFHFDRWDAHAVYFIDPSGNIVEFIARHTLKNDAAGDFGVDDILYASEIGVVTPDVASTAGELKQRLALNDYKFTSDGFQPVGDEHGLFIVFKVGRIWLASNRGTSVFPAHATINAKLGAPLEINQAKFNITSA